MKELESFVKGCKLHQTGRKEDRADGHNDNNSHRSGGFGSGCTRVPDISQKAREGLERFPGLLWPNQDSEEWFVPRRNHGEACPIGEGEPRTPETTKGLYPRLTSWRMGDASMPNAGFARGPYFGISAFGILYMAKALVRG